MSNINILNKLWLISEQTRSINIRNSNIRTDLEINDVVEAYSVVVDMLDTLSKLTENILALEESIKQMIPEDLIADDEEVDILPK